MHTKPPIYLPFTAHLPPPTPQKTHQHKPLLTACSSKSSQRRDSTMVVPLGPGKFYGSGLPRPRIYTDVKHNTERVDPPVPVTDPFLSWAQEAHWSMGGLSFTRLRYQGRIEGNAKKLRKLREKKAKLQAKSSPKISKDVAPDSRKGNDKKRGGSVSPPPAPKVTKKRRFLQLIDEESGEEEDQQVDEGFKKGTARKLVADFERVANESQSVRVSDLVKKVVEEVSRGGNKKKVDEEVIREVKKPGDGKKGKRSGGEIGSGVGDGIRTSPRLVKKKSS